MKDDPNNESLPKDETKPEKESLAANNLDVKNLDTAITDDLDPAEKDARWLRRWYPLSFVTKVAIVLALILLFIIFFLFLSYFF